MSVILGPSCRVPERGGRLVVAEQTATVQSGPGTFQEGDRTVDTSAESHLAVSSWNWASEPIPQYHGTAVLYTKTSPFHDLSLPSFLSVFQ